MKPVIAISLGCPAGIGPEIVAASLQDACQICTPVLFGHFPTFESVLRTLPSSPPKVKRCPSPVRNPDCEVQFIHTGGPEISITSPDAAAAKSQFCSLEAAVDAVLDGICDGITTAPVSKQMVATISPDFTGHTEYLASRCGRDRDDVTMLFASDRLVVGLLTTHLPLRNIPDTLTEARYLRTLRHTAKAITALTGKPLPDIAVAALNPHAGEGGLLGTEEREILAPFCRRYDGQFARLHGPISADAVFRDAFSGSYDGVIAAYHDQALIPLKLGGFGNAVNVTAGLSFVRTSPDHGTGHDIAQKGLADASAMGRAIQMAARLITGTRA